VISGQRSRIFDFVCENERVFIATLFFAIEEQSSMAISAVIFDYGMVLSGPADAAAHHELVEIFGAPAEVFEREYWAYRHAYDEGKFDGPGYWRQCAESAGMALSEDQIRRLIRVDIRMWSTLNPAMVEWAVAITSARLKTGILSNIGFELADAIKEQNWVKGLTHNTWSCELRLAKPDPSIYHHVLNAIQLPAEEVLFLDDRQENILSAEAVGLHGIIFRNVQQLQEDLQARGLASLLPPLRSEHAVPAPAL
jgi:putative hydrolase of the HAD superfamily